MAKEIIIKDGDGNQLLPKTKAEFVVTADGGTVEAKLAQAVEIDSEMSSTSTNGIQNKVVKAYVDAETSARTSADATLTANLATEVSAREAAVDNLNEAIASGVGTTSAVIQPTMTSTSSSTTDGVSAKGIADFVAEQKAVLQTEIGTLSDLETTEKGNLVDAINEVMNNSSLADNSVTYEKLSEDLQDDLYTTSSTPIYVTKDYPFTDKVAGWWSNATNPVLTSSQSGVNYVTAPIKLEDGDSIQWNVSGLSGATILTQVDGGTLVVGSTGTRLANASQLTGTYKNETGADVYVSLCYKEGYTHEATITTKSPTGVVCKIALLDDRVTSLEEGGGSVTPLPEYGYFGTNYPSQVSFIKNTLMQSMTDQRLTFVHISDTHIGNTGDFGNACDFTDKIGADFMVNTGDICGGYRYAFTPAETQINAMTKPCYLVMGNHDYEGMGGEVIVDSSSMYDKYYDTTNAHNGLDTDKTYFSVVKNGIKSIFVDQYSAISGTGLPSTAIMSQEEVNWFIEELKDATTNGYHVVCFIHAPFPTSNELVQQGWDDYYWNSGKDSGCMKNDVLMKIVDAWMNGTSFSLTYNGNTYTDTFSGYGIFVGWFCGHSHCHTMGRLDGYPKQRFFATQAGKGVGRNYSTLPANVENVTFVSVHPKKRSVSIYNVGAQVTTAGNTRSIITYKY